MLSLFVLLLTIVSPIRVASIPAYIPAKAITVDPILTNIGDDQFPPTRLFAPGDVYVYYFDHMLINIEGPLIVHLLLEFSRRYSVAVPSFETTVTIVDTSRFAECLSSETNCSSLTDMTVSNEVYQDGNYTEIDVILQSDFTVVEDAFVIVRVIGVTGNVVVPLNARLQIEIPNPTTLLQETYTFPVASNDQVLSRIGFSFLQWTAPSLIPRIVEATVFVFHESFPVTRADMMTITIAVPRAVSVVELFNRRLLRMSVINTGNSVSTSSCMFPLDNNLCPCTTLATVDVNDTMFLIEGRFACSFTAAVHETKTVVVTRISTGAGGDPTIDGFPDIIPTALTDIIFRVDTTSFVSVTTVSTTSSLSSATTSTANTTPVPTSSTATSSTLSSTTSSSTTGPPSFNASDNRVESLGGAGIRVAVFSTIGGAAALAVIIVIILSCLL